MSSVTQQVRGQPELHNTFSQKVKKEKEKKENSHKRALGHRKQILLSDWVTRSSERNQGPQDLQYSRKETGVPAKILPREVQSSEGASGWGTVRLCQGVWGWSGLSCCPASHLHECPSYKLLLYFGVNLLEWQHTPTLLSLPLNAPSRPQASVSDVELGARMAGHSSGHFSMAHTA